MRGDGGRRRGAHVQVCAACVCNRTSNDYRGSRVYEWVERKNRRDARGNRWTTKASRSSRSLKLAANDRGSGGLN